MWALTLWNSSNFSDSHSSKYSQVKILRHTVCYIVISTKLLKSARIIVEGQLQGAIVRAVKRIGYNNVKEYTKWLLFQ